MDITLVEYAQHKYTVTMAARINQGSEESEF